MFSSLGTDKSSIFVAMCILVMQLKTEKRIDICTVVRKLRAQRHLMIDTYVSILSIQWTVKLQVQLTPLGVIPVASHSYYNNTCFVTWKIRN